MNIFGVGERSLRMHRHETYFWMGIMEGALRVEISNGVILDSKLMRIRVILAFLLRIKWIG